MAVSRVMAFLFTLIFSAGLSAEEDEYFDTMSVDTIDLIIQSQKLNEIDLTGFEKNVGLYLINRFAHLAELIVNKPNNYKTDICDVAQSYDQVSNRIIQYLPYTNSYHRQSLANSMEAYDELFKKSEVECR